MDTNIEIVLVEDKVQDAELTVRALNKHSLSHRLIHLRNQEDIRHFLESPSRQEDFSTGHLPKVILLSMDLQDIKAMDILRAIRTHQLLKTVPVVVLTAGYNEEDLHAAYELGINSYIVKPPAFSDFIAVMSELGLYWMLLNKYTVKEGTEIHP